MTAPMIRFRRHEVPNARTETLSLLDAAYISAFIDYSASNSGLYYFATGRLYLAESSIDEHLRYLLLAAGPAYY